MQITLWAQISLAPVVWTTLGIISALGMLAIVSPSRFTALTTRSSTWVDTDKFLTALDKRIDIDKYVLPFSRTLGVSVVLAAAIIALICWKYQLR